MVSTYRSVFRMASPMPGKCFMVASTPLDASPAANASASRAVRPAWNEKVRPCWYMNDAVEPGMSATGARSTLMPSCAGQRRS